MRARRKTLVIAFIVWQFFKALLLLFSVAAWRIQKCKLKTLKLIGKLNNAVRIRKGVATQIITVEKLPQHKKYFCLIIHKIV